MAGVLIHLKRDTFISEIVKTTVLRLKQTLSNISLWKYMPNE